jgi:hypothetical protein
MVRITDNWNGPSRGDRATVTDVPFSFTAQCSATGEVTFGSSCSVATTADALTPGTVVEGARANWQIDAVEVADGGADGSAATADNTLFARQGVFIP